MAARWYSKHEEEELKKKSLIKKDIDHEFPIKIDFNEDNDYKRVRKLSKTEKIFKAIEKGAIAIAKLRMKLKKNKKNRKESNGEHELKDSEKELMITQNKEKFRRLISFIFSDHYLEEFLSVMEALSFKKLGGFEYLGRRDADYSIAMDYGDKYRLHSRVYRIKGNIYVLVHHEPKASQDVKLHITGYFDRIYNALHKREQRKRLKRKNVEKNDKDKIEESENKKELNIEGGSDGKEKVELSNYELGTDILLKILQENVPNFYKKLQTKISKEDIKLWEGFVGKIDHLSPVELLIENLYESSRYIPPFIQVRDTAKKIFQQFGFKTNPAWDLNVPATDKYFIAKSEHEIPKCEILIITDDLNDDILRPIGLLRAKYNPEFVLLIAPDISIFGPTQDDIPPKNIEISPFDPTETKNLIQFLKESDISIAPVSFIIDLLRISLKSKVNCLHFNTILNSKGLLTPKLISESFKKQSKITQFRKDVMEVFNIFKNYEKNKWISLRKLEKLVKEKEISLDSSELINIIALMENPLVGLIKTKNKKRSKYRLRTSLTEKQIRNKLEKLNKMLNSYLTEAKFETI